MGRICPILNHPLVDGVLIGDEAVVAFIHKRNLDFLSTELVCRSCKIEVIKLYNKKLKKAKDLHRSRKANGSISSYIPSKSSNVSTISEGSLNENLQPVQAQATLNGRSSSNNTSINQLSSNSNINSNVHELANIPTSSVSEASIIMSTSISNIHNILQENQKIHGLTRNQPHVTIRKKTIKDYLIDKPSEQNAPTNTLPKQMTSHQTADDENDDGRRLSQEPTTSHAAIRNKRPLSTIYEIGDISDDDADDAPLILHAIRGTRLPNIQPIPPKRKPPAEGTSLAQDIMDEYIKDIRGG